MSHYFIIAIGLTAQFLFSARLIVQWIASEKAQKVLSPTLFWQLSMVSSFLMCQYGWLRNDFAIILGQLISYYIYIWNLNLKGAWNKLLPAVRMVVLLIPIVAMGYFLIDWDDTFVRLFRQSHIPIGLLLFGVVGQFTFTIRFVYQWRYSRRAGESLLPAMFWVISLVGSFMIIIYAIIRHDAVLILGQATGFVVYVRNIMIDLKSSSKHNKQDFALNKS